MAQTDEGGRCEGRTMRGAAVAGPGWRTKFGASSR
jgi:hypothetical protein